MEMESVSDGGSVNLSWETYQGSPVRVEVAYSEGRDELSQSNH